MKGRSRSIGKWLLVLAMVLPVVLVVVVMAALSKPVAYELGVNHEGVATEKGVVSLVDVLNELDGVKASCSHEPDAGSEFTVLRVEMNGGLHVVSVHHPVSQRVLLGLEELFSATLADEARVYRRSGDFSTRLCRVDHPNLVTDEVRELSNMVHEKILSVAQVRYRPLWGEQMEKLEIWAKGGYKEISWKLGEWWDKVRL